MKKSLIALTVALLLLTTLSAGASAPAPGPFSTTGYTTNLVIIPGYPSPLPTEYASLPGGYAKFHIRAQGGPAYADDLLCQTFYPPVTKCEELCAPFDETCGAHGDFEGGSFAFDEWAIVDETFAGVNEGLLTVSTGSGSTDMHFGGTAGAGAVGGGFEILGGSGGYKKLAGGGTYAGNAGYVFKVAYIPCGGDGQPACPTSSCTERGGTLKLKNAKATWELVNGGEQPVVLQSLLLFWPEANGALTSVSLGGKTLAEGPFDEESQDDGVRWVQLNLTGQAQDREIRGGKKSTLTLEFERKGIGDQPADYTFQAGFGEGCSAIHVAF
jgi:hypothetical protein